MASSFPVGGHISATPLHTKDAGRHPVASHRGPSRHPHPHHHRDAHLTPSTNHHLLISNPFSFVPPGPTPRGPLDDAPTMFSRRPTPSPRPLRCTYPSTASITTGLLLSLLALSAAPAVATGHTRQDAQVVFPIEASPLIPPLLPEPPAPAQHTFVRAPLLLTKCSGPNSTLHRPSDTYTTMGRTDIRRSIAR